MAEIFEKINSKGTRLGIFDLLNARLTKYGVTLKALWKEANRDHNIKEMSSKLTVAKNIFCKGSAFTKMAIPVERNCLDLMITILQTQNSKIRNLRPIG